jgi:hypothetical protein
MEFESPDVMPSVIYPEAWEVAMTINEEVRKFMAEFGLIRVEGRSKMTEITARMVQLAINKTFARAVKEAEQV